ncbi:MAG: AAA family ATPase [Ruminococcaceae bacterium]|nr:AAA family ATPase [Oscillospiraceae bacterium]
MAEIKNSALLDSLLSYSKFIGNNTLGILTVERFLLAVIKTVQESTGTKETAIITIFKEIFIKNGIDMDVASDILNEYVSDPKSTGFLDELYMKRKLKEATEKAVEKKHPCLTPELLLEVIFAVPNERIRNCIRKSYGTEWESGKKNGNEGEKPLSSISDEEKKKIKENFAKKFKMDCDEDVALEEKKPAKKPQPEVKLPQEKLPDNPKEKMEYLVNKVKNIQKALSGKIFGQDNAISVFASGYFRSELLALTDKTRTRPRATFLFAGPPGVGKTFLAESAAMELGLPFMRFDMSEYADKEANIEFCGSDKVYKNGKAGNVTSFVEKNPRCVLLFDEIEKAHMCVIHLFLQMLDAGRLRDNYTDNEVSFSDTIIILTTNAGKQLYENSENGDFSCVTRKVILKALQNDKNPETGVPFFPGAICSRFASGNVVMFNHISAHSLRMIAKNEVLRHARDFENEIGVKVDIDEKVYTALLFAEGGATDARTVRSRAEAFFDDELFELFRLAASDSLKGSVKKINNINITLDLPSDNDEVLSLFEGMEPPKVIVFAQEEIAQLCSDARCGCSFIHVSDLDSAKKVIRENEIALALFDVNYGIRNPLNEYLNVEDVDSSARDFLHFIRENYNQLPTYLLETRAHQFNDEEKVSFMRQGVRGVITLEGNKKSFSQDMDIICAALHQQNSMETLAKANKLVRFETAQCLKNGGKTAEIRLFDFRMEIALDAEDSENILSNVSKPNISFDKVIGAEDAKKELKYFAEYLRNPKKYIGTGVRAPRGVLLYGPPGTGKTMLAKAMASESDATFITAEGNQFLKKYVGEGPEKVHELFRTARKYAPAIVFVDEIDAIAKERKGGDNNSGAEEILTAFLTEMDGFKNDVTKPVFVLAATNFDVEPGSPKSLDGALMRRFDRRVYIDLPNKQERIRYMRLKASENPIYTISEEKIENIAVRSTGMSLAALESVFEMSLRTAIREGDIKVTDEAFEEAFETFTSGEKKKWDPSQLERTARHEAGHAFICYESGETPSYLTVVARGDHGGYMQHGDTENKGSYTKDELVSRIRTALGGRAAEIVYYGNKDGISTGASGDLNSATNMAQHIICTYGMDEEFGLATIESESARSGELSREVRSSVNKILAEQLQLAVEIIEKNRKKMDALVDALITQNHLSGAEIESILKG